MTSATFRTISISSITIDRASRQRRDLGDTSELAASIAARGLINPITVTPDFVLVAGERRLTACRSLGWDSIPAQLTSDLDSTELHAIELEENIKRQDLSWQDRTNAIEAYHELQRARNPAWNFDATAKAIGVTDRTVRDHVEVARAIRADPRVAAAPKYSVAKGIVERANERRQTELLSSVAPAVASPFEVLNDSFHTWQPPVDYVPNFVHCDFPYGVGAGKFNQGAGAAHGSYSDDVGDYFALIARLGDWCARGLIADSAHLMFWFSMIHYDVTLKALRGQGWRVDPFPLIWFKSDNTGILPDPSRGPRRVYETAFYGSRGDRKIVSAVANVFAGPASNDIHMSQKSSDMLRHFFRMFVDESSIVLDPTCGSGSAVIAADGAGARRVIGLEIDKTFATRAQESLAKVRIK